MHKKNQKVQKTSTPLKPKKPQRLELQQQQQQQQTEQKKNQFRRKGVHRRPQENYSWNEADDRIFSIFRNHGFADYPHEKRQKLTSFYQLLMREQKEQNFTRLITLRDVAIKHFIDCLIVPRLTDLDFPLLDIGTGPGFPGIPLKIHFPDEHIILAEGVQKRVDFLKAVRDQLELKNLDILGQKVGREFHFPVCGVITRAVEEIALTLGHVKNCLPAGGRAFFMKGPNVGHEISSALEQHGEYFELDQDIAYDLPETPHQRRLVIFRRLDNPSK